METTTTKRSEIEAGILQFKTRFPGAGVIVDRQAKRIEYTLPKPKICEGPWADSLLFIADFWANRCGVSVEDYLLYMYK